MLFVKPERPVDALTIAVSREIDRVARDLELPYFLAGAMARDILLTHVFGIAIGRATRDVDFGVAVRNWEQFDGIRRTLIETGRFSPADKSMQRIYYKSQSSSAGYRHHSSALELQARPHSAEGIATERLPAERP